MKTTRIFGLVGEKGSGKGTVAAYLKQRYGASHYTFSAPLNDILKRLHIPLNREAQAKLGMALRQTFGENTLASVLVQDIEQDPHAIIAVDGIRYWNEQRFLKQFPNFHLIAVHANLQARFERIRNRGEKANEHNLSYEDFLREHEFPTEKQISEITQTADTQMNNDGSLSDLYRQIDALMHSLNIQPHER